ncbi:butyrophilin subfamily 3 member A2-like, partial [Plectropomus leopardus]|uniref:butyrophilin subfamily 3 member A2-like n=1 Tax=Plectropomus leopardus TaxID=160734 RepID=UPI001C4CD229
MLHVTDRRSLNFQFGAFTVLVLHVLTRSCRGQSQVIVPAQPVVALLGDDVILPCRLDPAMNAFGMMVEWLRPDLDPRFVLVWRDGVELKSKKHTSYRGRASVFTDELKHGNVSLKLSNVKRSDEGTYRCFIPGLGRAATVQLVVGAVSSLHVKMTSINSSRVVLQCESAGWYPEPEVLWLDGEGNVLSAGPAETVRGPDDLYTVSSRISVDKRHGNNFTCRVQHNVSQTRPAFVRVQDHYFVVPTTPSAPSTPGSPHVVIGSVIGCAALMLILAVVFVVWKRRQNKFKNKRTSPEDGPEPNEEEKTDASKNDNTGFQVVTEGGGERTPLIAAREEEVESHRERDDSQRVAEIKTHQPDGDGTEGERELKSVKNQKATPNPSEG